MALHFQRVFEPQPGVRLILGDARQVLKTFPPSSVHTVITGPPSWGLRDYGVVSQIGLEPSPQAYVQALMDVFREVYSVLKGKPGEKPDGTLWFTVPDRYGPGSKSLLDLPHRILWALTAEGWCHRQTITLHKPNAKPESALDRPTRSHDELFQLATAEDYYYNGPASREPVSKVQRFRQFGRREYKSAQRAYGYRGARALALLTGQGTATSMGNDLGREFGEETNRNLRTVWRTSAKSYEYLNPHLAAFSEDWVKKCVLAGSPKDRVVLDPFCGSGTVGVVAYQCGMRFIGIDVDPDSIALAYHRLQHTVKPEDPPLLDDAEVG